MNLFYKYLKYLWKQAENEWRVKILSLIKLIGGATILDCGCDDGSFTLEVARKVFV